LDHGISNVTFATRFLILPKALGQIGGLSVECCVTLVTLVSMAIIVVLSARWLEQTEGRLLADVAGFEFPRGAVNPASPIPPIRRIYSPMVDASKPIEANSPIDSEKRPQSCQ
jgi:hypothetical protein